MLVRPLGQLLAQRRTAQFAARVRAGLAELGLQVAKFDAPLRRLFDEVCVSCHQQQKDLANPYALAVEFFLRVMIEYPRVVSSSAVNSGALLESVGVLRTWHVKGRIDAERTQTSIAHVKRYLTDQLKNLDLTDEARLETELRIREL
jgi:formate-dependent nitrite reductase cytochrome c552 subunit